MIEYALSDSYGNEFNLNGSSSSLLGILKNTFTIKETILEREINIIQKSYKDGAVCPGTQRSQSKSLPFSFEIAIDDVSLFKSNFNNLEYWCRKAEKIIDKTNNLITPVKFKELSIPYDAGSLMKSATCSLVFVQLDPYWFNEEYTVLNRSGAAIEIPYVNNGFVDAFPVITLEANSGCQDIVIIESTTRRGLIITDFSFGQEEAYNTLTIDCEEGKVLLSGFTGTRNNRIKAGTGFFHLPVGSGNIEIQTSVSVDAEVKFRKGYLL